MATPSTSVSVNKLNFCEHEYKSKIEMFIDGLRTSSLGEAHSYDILDCKAPIFGDTTLFKTNKIYIRECYRYFIYEIDQMFTEENFQQKYPNKLYSIMGTPGIGN